MARPRHELPTPAELEVLQVIWEQGPSTVRQVMDVLCRTRRRAYTSVMSLLGVMADKGLLARRPKGRAFEYVAEVQRDATQSQMVGDLVNRAFGGSATALVCHLVGRSSLNDQELDEIRNAIADSAPRLGSAKPDPDGQKGTP